MKFVKYDITFETDLESEGEIFMCGRINFKRQKCSFLVVVTFLDFQGFQGKEKQNDCSFKL